MDTDFIAEILKESILYELQSADLRECEMK